MAKFPLLQTVLPIKFPLLQTYYTTFFPLLQAFYTKFPLLQTVYGAKFPLLQTSVAELATFSPVAIVIFNTFPQASVQKKRTGKNFPVPFSAFPRKIVFAYAIISQVERC